MKKSIQNIVRYKYLALLQNKWHINLPETLIHNYELTIPMAIFLPKNCNYSKKYTKLRRYHKQVQPDFNPA